MRGSRHKMKQEGLDLDIGEILSPEDSEAGWL